LQVSWSIDAEECKHALNDIDAVDWLVVDHYALDRKWESNLTHLCRHIMIIDDLADREHIADILLDQNLYPNMDHRYSELVRKECLSLLGPSYTLLRKEFTKLRAKCSPRTKLNRILVCFGGVDAQNLTTRTIVALQQLDFDFHIDVIIGRTNSHRQKIQDACAQSKNIQWYINASNIAEFMLKADIAIGAGGTTTWERCFMGLPAIVFSVAENQINTNKTVSAQGACILANDKNDIRTEIITHIQSIIEHPNILSDMSKSAYDIMKNHKGTKYIVKKMEAFEIF